MRPTLNLCLVALFVLAGVASAVADISYEGDVRKVLKKHCVVCHKGTRARADLDLSSYEAILAGSASGEVVIAGKADDSFLYLVTAHLEEPVMPPGDDRVPDEDLEILRQWINAGLPKSAADLPDAAAMAEPAAEPTPASASADALARGPVVALAASTDGGLLAVGEQLRVVLHDAGDGSVLGVLPFPEGEPQSLRFTADGQHLVAGGGVHGESGAVVVWSLDPPQRVWSYEDEDDAVLGADLDPTRALVVLSGQDRLAKLISTETGDVLHELEKHTDWALDATFSPDGLLVATADRDGGVYVWEARSGAALHSLRGHKGAVKRLAWQSGGDVLVTASEDGTIRRWDMHAGKPLNSWTAHNGGVLDLAANASGELFSVGRDGQWRSWTIDGKRLSEPFETSSVPAAVGAVNGRPLFGDLEGRVLLSSASGPIELASPSGSSAAEMAGRVPASIAPADRLVALVPLTSQPSASTQPAAEPSIVIEPSQASARIDRLHAAIDRIETQLAAPGGADLTELEAAVERASLADQAAAAKIERFAASAAKLRDARGSLAAGEADSADGSFDAEIRQLVGLADRLLERELVRLNAERTAASEALAAAESALITARADRAGASEQAIESARAALAELRDELQALRASLSND